MGWFLPSAVLHLAQNDEMTKKSADIALIAESYEIDQMFKSFHADVSTISKIIRTGDSAFSIQLC